jgi:signal transduction histidine kinase
MGAYSILQFVLLIIAIIVNIILGIFIYQSNRKSATNILFASLSVTMSFWLVFNYLSVDLKFLQHSLTFIRLSIFWATPMSVLFFLLASTIPAETIQMQKKYLWFFSFSTVATMVITVSPYAFKTILIVNNSPQPIAGPGLIPFAIVSTLSSVGAVYVLFKKIQHAEGEAKGQLQSMMYGVLIMLGLVILTIFVPAVLFQINAFIPFLPFYTLIFLGMTAYAIVKHHLFNIKIIATEAFTTILCIVLLTRTITATATTEVVVDIFVLLAATGFGILLIRSVRNEVEQREQLQKLTTDLATANEQLKALDKARAEFISIASHQLRTPPATVKWYLSAIINGDYGPLDPEVKGILVKTERTNNLLISLIEDILNASRIERGKMEFLFGKTDILELAQVTYEQLQPLAMEKKQKLVFVAPKTKIPTMMADKEKLRQVMNNLIDNAIKYTPSGGTITVSLSKIKGEAQFQVADTGKGISPQDQQAIFKKYSRGKESIKQSAGLGLGLYVAEVIIAQHKGKIWAESDGEGKGSRFIFSLPIKNDLKATTLFDFNTSSTETPAAK